MTYKYNLLPAQLEFMNIPHEEQSDIALYQGGYGCVDGDTELDTLFGKVKIKDFNGGFIWSYFKGKKVLLFATKPKIYNKKPLFEVITKNGLKITCTKEHKFLTKDGFKPLSSLNIGDEVCTYSQNLPHSNSEHAPSKFSLNVLHLMKIIQDFLLRYFVGYRLCDEQPQMVEDNDQDGLPSQDDVHEHNLYHHKMGDQVVTEEYNHQHQFCDHPSTNHYENQLDHLASNKECCADGNTSVLLWQICLIQVLFLCCSYLLLPFQLFWQLFHNLFCKSYFKTSFSSIDIITYKKVDLYYDINVPVTNCYNAQGFVNHNSGKTFCGSLISVLLCLKYDGIRGLIGAMTFPLVRDTTLVSFKEHLDNMGLVAGYHYTENISQAKITFYNGSEVLFRHLEEPDKLKSLNLGFVELEEMSDTPESTFLMLLSRLRQAKREGWDKTAQLEGHKGFQYRLFGHTNPEPNKGWIYKNFVEKKQSNYRLILAPTTQNVFLPEGYIENMKNAYDPEYYRINVLGEFGDYTSGLVVKGFSDENIVDCEYVPELDIWLTCDFNVDPMCWYVAHVTHNNKVYFIDEFCVENTHTKQVADEFIRRYKDHKKHIWITGDASGDYRKTQSAITDYVIIRDTLRNYYGHNAVDVKKRPFNPPVRARIAAWNTMVKNSNGERKLFMNKKCDKLIYNCYNLKYKTGTSIVDVPTYAQIANDRNLKFLEHPFDAASYLVELLYPITTANKRLLSEYK